MKMKYNKVLPTKDDSKIVDQFGFLPISIIKPTKESKERWSDAYLDDGEDEVRRGDATYYLPNYGFSEFHAGLAESIYRFWSMKGSVVVDPFAGRVTRAYVAESLGRKYTGFEISNRTYQRVHRHFSNTNLTPNIIKGDGTKLEGINDNSADLVFTCPPYYNIEKYESGDGQLADEPSYDSFMGKISECSQRCFSILKDGAFCCWVVADFRNGNGLTNFHGDTIKVFKEAGFLHHDTVIIENISPFAALQVGKAASKRYTSKIHEYLLVFRKPGDYIIPDYCQPDIMEIETNLKKFFDF